MGDKLLCGFLGFFVGGVLGGYFVGRMCGKKHREMIQKLRESDPFIEEDDWKDPFEEDEKETEEEKEEEANEGEPETERKHYNKDYESIKIKSATVAKSPDHIHLIDEETFQRDIDKRDNETLTYYQEDGVLVDSANEIIRNEEEVIGVEAMEKIFDCGEDMEYVYVSDDQEDKMYEVVVEHNTSYYRDVMGG